FFFFFSSRRRHTRSDRDWSSDVCSSDLNPEKSLALSQKKFSPTCSNRAAPPPRSSPPRASAPKSAMPPSNRPPVKSSPKIRTTRSEERRVGKEGRLRWWTDE